MPATLQPKLSTWGGWQGRELLSLGLCQHPLPSFCSPHPLAREIQENQLLWGTSWGLLKAVSHGHQDDACRAQVHVTAGGREPWAVRVGGPDSALSAPNPSLSAHLKPHPTFAEETASPAWSWPSTGTSEPQLPRLPSRGGVCRLSGLEWASSPPSRAPLIPRPPGYGDTLTAHERGLPLALRGLLIPQPRRPPGWGLASGWSLEVS